MADVRISTRAHRPSYERLHAVLALLILATTRPSAQSQPHPQPCGSEQELVARCAEVTAECCDEPSEVCTGGMPTACNAGCANLLLGVRDDCATMLSAGGAFAQIKRLLDQAATLCPPPTDRFVAESPPHHVIFFLVDDMGFADASYKAELYDKVTATPPTPTMDALARAGVRLESYYVNSLCSPTRTALLSGRYAYTNGMGDGVITNGMAEDLPLNLLTIADHLSGHAWRTAAFGKVSLVHPPAGSAAIC